MAIGNSSLRGKGRNQRGIAGTRDDRRRRAWQSYNAEEAHKRRMIRTFGVDALLSYHERGDYATHDVPEHTPLQPLKSLVKHIPGYALLPSGREVFQPGYIFCWGNRTGVLVESIDMGRAYLFIFENGEERTCTHEKLLQLHHSIHPLRFLPPGETERERIRRQNDERYQRRKADKAAAEVERKRKIRMNHLLLILKLAQYAGTYPLLPPPGGSDWALCKACGGAGGDNKASRSGRSHPWVTCKRCDGRGTTVKITDGEVVVCFHQDGARATYLNPPKRYPLGSTGAYATNPRTTARTIILKLQEATHGNPA